MRRYGDWVGGVEQHRTKYRFKVVGGGRAENHSFATREEAEAAREAVVKHLAKAKQALSALTWEDAIGQYMEHQADRAKAKAETLTVTRDRLRAFFLPDLTKPVGLTTRDGERLYKALRTRPGARGKPCSVQYHHHCLSMAKALVKWMVGKKMLREDDLAEVETVGVPRKGEESKPQLNRDGLRRLVGVALDMAEKGDAGAVATLCASLLGMRASAIANRRREHLDDGGRVLRSDGKGQSVAISLVGQTAEQEEIMARLRYALLIQARGKAPLAPLIGTGHDRWWVRREVARLCELAGVRVVPPHGLRATHASVGRELGISPALLAGALAHSEEVQERHYATAGAMATGAAARVVGMIGGPNRSPIGPPPMK